MSGEPINILIVDDDPALLRLLRKWMESSGFTVSKTVAAAVMSSDATSFASDSVRRQSSVKKENWSASSLSEMSCRS